MTTDDELPDAMTRHVSESFGRQGLMCLLGAELDEVRRGYCRLRVPYREQLAQQHGYFHAGTTTALIDTAGGYAGLSTFEPIDSVLTVDFTVNLLAPADGEVLVAEGRVLRSGRTLTVCDLDAYTLDGSARRHVATGRQTLIRLAGRSDQPG